MNLKPLFEMQKALDERIIEEKGLEGQDLLPEKILALQVELGELANEWRGFKFWSENREPSWNVIGEYVDCLHFTLSIGLEHGFDEWLDCLEIEPITCLNEVYQFSMLMRTDWDQYQEGDGGYYHEGLELFLGLGEMLGFTWEQIELAYKEKNATNHLRQRNGY